MIITAGIGHENPDLAWRPEAETIAVNVTGFAAMANVAMRHFLARGSGHLDGISSIAGIRADGRAPAYGASKAFVARYLQALRHKVAKQKLPIHITAMQAGFVDTAMANRHRRSGRPRQRDDRQCRNHRGTLRPGGVGKALSVPAVR